MPTAPPAPTSSTLPSGDVLPHDSGIARELRRDGRPRHRRRRHDQRYASIGIGPDARVRWRPRPGVSHMNDAVVASTTWRYGRAGYRSGTVRRRDPPGGRFADPHAGQGADNTNPGRWERTTPTAGGIATFSGRLDLSDGSVQDNTTGDDGGGIAMKGGDLTLDTVSIDQNTATGPGTGGGVSTDGALAGGVSIGSTATGDFTDVELRQQRAPGHRRVLRWRRLSHRRFSRRRASSVSTRNTSARSVVVAGSTRPDH